MKANKESTIVSGEEDISMVEPKMTVAYITEHEQTD